MHREGPSETGTFHPVNQALADGKPVITFERDVMNLLSADSKAFALKFKE